MDTLAEYLKLYNATPWKEDSRKASPQKPSPRPDSIEVRAVVGPVNKGSATMAVDPQDSWQNEFFIHLSKALALLVRAGMGPQSTAVSTEPGCFDIKEACNYICIGETKFRELVRDGVIPEGFEFGGRPHWTKPTLDKAIAKIERQQRK